ncbi:MAG: myo-inositol 2-dehydrogenase / D-chiro-inositol 1-dehydrogenase [Pseudonocardiales bacterium]|nr:myo-inositol 2-dehydrogenase / D-chiro-inositol 1-dehydrogenase [Pseudonocardiales bacterium]
MTDLVQVAHGRTLRIGVIGAGIMGADHAHTLRRFVRGAEVTAVADVDPARAEAAAASENGVDGVAYDDAAALIADPDVDAVVIASHDSVHAEQVVAAVRAGKPVLCEKPLAPTLAQCRRVLAEIGTEGAGLLSLGFMRRFDPGYVALRTAIGDRTVGAPVLLHNVSRGVSAGPGATSESSITGSSIHEFDVVPWLLRSPVVEVSWAAPARSVVDGLQDPQLITLRTADGVLSTCETFLNARYGYDIRCEVVGETGAMSLTEPARVRTDAARHHGIGYAADWRPRFADAYRLELQAWVDAVLAGAPTPLASARDGVAASAVAEAVITSMHEGGRRVEVEQP